MEVLWQEDTYWIIFIINDINLYWIHLFWFYLNLAYSTSCL